MYRKVSLSSFHNGKVEYCAISGSGDIEENASVIFFYSDFISLKNICVQLMALFLKLLPNGYFLFALTSKNYILQNHWVTKVLLPFISLNHKYGKGKNY